MRHKSFGNLIHKDYIPVQLRPSNLSKHTYLFRLPTLMSNKEAWISQYEVSECHSACTDERLRQNFDQWDYEVN